MAISKPKLYAIIGGAVLVAAIGAWVMLKPAAPKAGAPGQPGAQQAGAPGGPGGRPGGGRGGPTQVNVAVVSSRVFASRIEALGTLAPRERVQLTANAAERVTAVHFEDGQRVKQGAVLLTLAQDEERAQLEAAQATQADTLSTYNRNQRLSTEGAISPKELDTSKAASESAAANVRSLQARLRDRVLLAPFSGVLGFRQVSTGAYVAPGQVVATLIDDSEMRLEFGVPSIYLTEVRKGLVVEATTADLVGHTFTGTVTSVDNAIDPVTRAFKVRATLPNSKGELKAGMFMNVALLSKSHTALSVPEISIVSEGEETSVFVVERGQPGGPGAQGAPGAPGGQRPPEGAQRPQGQPGAAPGGPGGGGPTMLVKKRTIKVGVREKGAVEVLEGLKPGEQVVTDGILKVRPNAPVRIQEKQGEGGGPDGAPRVAEGDRPSDKSSLRQ